MDIKLVTEFFHEMEELNPDTRFPKLPIWAVIDSFKLSLYEVDNQPYYFVEGGMGLDVYCALLNYKEDSNELCLLTEADWAPDRSDAILYSSKEEQIEYLLTECRSF